MRWIKFKTVLEIKYKILDTELTKSQVQARAKMSLLNVEKVR